MKARALGLALAACALALPAGATEFNAGPNLINVHTKTLLDMKFKGVMHQTHDLSCGAAALGTLLKYYYGEDVTEEQIIREGFEVGDEEKIKQDGFSMLELKKISEKRGYVVGGFRIPDAQKLANLKVPVLTLVNVRGYNHFVVIMGVEGGRVFIADPAFGNRSRTLESFGSDWGHVILVVLNANRAPGEGFALRGATKAPLHDLVPILQQQFTPPTVDVNRF